MNYYKANKSTERSGKSGITPLLRNTLLTVSDRRIPHLDIDSNIIYYDPDVRTMTDYYPFGMEMPGRVANLLDVYSVTDTVSTPEPLTVYGSNPYTSTANMDFTLSSVSGSFDFSIVLDMTSFVGDILVTIRDDQNNPVYTCTAHSSQVIYQVTASRVPVTGTAYTATAEPLGMYTGSFVIMFSPVLHYTTRLDWVCSTSQVINYIYGYNGKEKDNEVKGEGNQYDYGFRNYDPRIGKFLSIDPLIKKFPELTPYLFASNTPIWGVDLNGLELMVSTLWPDATYRESLLKTIDASIVPLNYIHSGEDLLNKMESVGKPIDLWINFSHGGYHSIFEIGKPDNAFATVTLWKSNTSRSIFELGQSIKDNKITFSKNAVVILGNCNNGAGDFAEDLCRTIERSVIATNGDFSPQEESNGKMVYKTSGTFYRFDYNSETGEVTSTPLGKTLNLTEYINNFKETYKDQQLKEVEEKYPFKIPENIPDDTNTSDSSSPSN